MTDTRHTEELWTTSIVIPGGGMKLKTNTQLHQAHAHLPTEALARLFVVIPLRQIGGYRLLSV